MSLLVLCVTLVLFTISSTSPLENQRRERDSISDRLKRMQESLQMGKDAKGTVEYERYWRELLANNPELAQKFKNLPPEEIAKKFGRLANRENNIRSQIDEIQRLNQEQLKEINRGRMNPPGLNRGPYNDSRFPRSFQKADDLSRGPNGERLSREEIKRKMEEHRKIQEELDAIRREEFEHFENKLENMRKKKLKEMDETQRLKEEERLDKLSKERADHERLAHPASRKQLEDVWVKQDGLGDEKFNPKTFFYLHDSNGDQFLDLYEVEALFMNEVKKMYGENGNNMMVQEELAEMREHVFGEVDRDRDGLISLEEFLAYSNKEIFNVDEEWKPLEEREKIVISPEEFDELESYGLDENYDVMYDSDDGKVTLIKKQKGDEGENKAEGEPEGVAGGVPEEHQTQEDLNKHVDDPQTNQNQENPPEHNSQAPPPQKPDEVDKPVPQEVPHSDAPQVAAVDNEAHPDQQPKPDEPRAPFLGDEPPPGGNL